MISKVYYPDDHEELMRACDGHLLEVFLPGQRVKSAASAVFSREDLRALAPPPGFFSAHVIGMGAHERYGWNRNGDAFTKLALTKYHPTFVAHGHLYREHRNRDPKTQGVGIIKAARFNPDMQRVELVVHADITKCPEEFQKASSGQPLSVSMSCFPAGTPVRLADGNTQTIESLQCGQQVVTQHGRIGEISHVLTRDYDGRGVELRAYGVADPIRMTEEHPVWIRPHKRHVHECPVCGERHKSLQAHLRQKLDVKHQAAYRDLPRYCEGFRPASQLLPGDWVRIPVSQSVTGEMDEDRAWLLGLYVAEGHIYRYDRTTIDRRTSDHKPHTYNYSRLDLTLGIHEIDLAEKARGILQRYTSNKVDVFTKPKGNTLKVRLTARTGNDACKIIDWLCRHGGHLAQAKRLSADVLGWNTTAQKRLVEGWLDGDSCWHRSKSYVSGVTVSRDLAEHIQLLLARCKIPSSINSRQLVGKRRAYTIQISSRFSDQIDFRRKPHGWSFQPTTSRPVGHLKHQADGRMVAHKPSRLLMEVDANGHLYSRIRSVKTIHLQEKVYDLTVPGDHGFVAGGIAVSNCTVPEDRCNCCGHLAKRASEYCEHAARMMNRYVPAFEKYAFVFNDDPTFFDLSWVRNPADRIAHFLSYRFGGDTGALQKAASEDLVVTGAEWAAYEGVRLDEPAWVKLSSEQLSALHDLAEAEEWLTQNTNPRGDDPRVKFASYVLPTAWHEPQISDQDLQCMREAQPGTLFYKLAKQACLLPWPVFVAYVTDRSLTQVMEDPQVKAAASLLPSLFRDTLGSVMGAGCCSPVADLFDAATPGQVSCDQNADMVDEIMGRMTDNFGAGLRPVQDRVTKVVIIKKSSDNITDAKPDMSLIEAYAMYKVAAVRDIYRLSDALDMRWLPMLAVSQNKFPV